jgi:hypothetical protein
VYNSKSANDGIIFLWKCGVVGKHGISLAFLYEQKRTSRIEKI